MPDHLLDGFEHHLGAGGAVAAGRVHGPQVELASECFGGRAVGHVAIVVDGDLRDEGNVVAGGIAGGENGFAKFVEYREGLEDHQIDAGLDQSRHVLPKNRAGLFERSGAQRLDANSQRAYRSRDKCSVAGCLPGQPYAGLVDGAQFFGEAKGSQPCAVGPERVGFDDLGAGLDVFLMHFLDQRRRGEIEFIETAIDEDALRVQHRAHGAIGHQHTPSKLLPELPGPVDRHWILTSKDSNFGAQNQAR